MLGLAVHWQHHRMGWLLLVDGGFGCIFRLLYLSLSLAIVVDLSL
jgi:hypothetical protein